MMDTGAMDLYKYLRKTANKKLSSWEVFTIFQKIVNCVSKAAKACSVYHGDLKTGNIIINKDKEVTVIDWGSIHVSKLLIKYESCTAQYASPESLSVLAGGEGYHPEALLVWSLGVILYELLTNDLFTPYHLKNFTASVHILTEYVNNR